MSHEWSYGIHAVDAILQRSPTKVDKLWLAQGRQDERVQGLAERARQAGIRVETQERRQFDELFGEQNHQGVAVYYRPRQLQREGALLEQLEQLNEPPLLLILDGVTDPHNLGACLRSADAAGAHAVVSPKDKAAVLNPTVRKVACGAAESVPFYAVTNLARTLEELKQAGVWIIGLAGEARQSIYQADLKGPTALVMGAEGSGLRRLTREHCDLLVKLPMAGSVSSLNVSVASGIALFEAVRQRSA